MTAPALLTITGLRTVFSTPEGTARAVDGVSFGVRAGETYALVGESGCGKSVTALSIMGLVPGPTGSVAGGEIVFEGRDLVGLGPEEMRKVRGGRIAMVFQEPMTSLNPVFTAGWQVEEALSVHATGPEGGAAARRAEALRWLERVRLPDPARAHASYPHQLSGGQRQRVMLAMALACRPALLIADEPTTALDVTIQQQILDLMGELKRETGTAVLLITHNLGIVREQADRVGIMYAGRLVEEAVAADLFRAPLHPYTRALMASVPGRGRRGSPLPSVPGTVPPATGYPAGCRFAPRCPLARESCRRDDPASLEARPGRFVACPFHAEPLPAADTALAFATPASRGPAPLVEARGLRVWFPVTRGVFRSVVGHVRAVDDVDLSVARGSVHALVGESGCGKTTLGNALLGLVPLTGGTVTFDGSPISGMDPRAMRPLRRRIQPVFQDPFSSLNPRLRVGDLVEESMLAHRGAFTGLERKARAGDALERVGLGAAVRQRYPHEFSGGQRQRICIARALAVGPDFVVCDEPTSALDVSVQAQVLNLLGRLKASMGLTYLLITHDLGVVEYFADEVSVMYLGRIVERGTLDEVFGNAAHPYTAALLAAVPTVEPRPGGRAPALGGDVPSPVSPPSGCRFHPRCPRAMPVCSGSEPRKAALSPSHGVSCHLYAPGG